MDSDTAEPAPDPPASRSPVIWILLGAAIAIGGGLAMRLTTAEPPAVTEPASAPPSAAATTSPRAEFAGLYLRYLLKTYYVYERGFCTALLEEICHALLETELLNIPSTCDSVPNDELVLAIGRFQHATALPVDGKAGPKTVRKILGGSFTNRRSMAQKYCPGWREPGASSAQVPESPANVTW